MQEIRTLVNAFCRPLPRDVEQQGRLRAFGVQRSLFLPDHREFTRKMLILVNQIHAKKVSNRCVINLRYGGKQKRHEADGVFCVGNLCRKLFGQCIAHAKGVNNG